MCSSKINKDNCDIFTLLNFHNVDVLFKDKQNILIYYPEIATAFCDCEDEQIYSLFSLLSKVTLQQVCSHNQKFADLFTNYNLSFISRYAYYNEGKQLLPSAEIEIKVATLENCDEIYSFYNHYVEHGYLRDRIEKGKMLVAYKNNILAGFIGVHTEGSIGMLYVKDEFRRQKIGTYLEVSMINKVLDENKPVFAQVTPGNLNSINQHKKLGFEISDKDIYWKVF